MKNAKRGRQNTFYKKSKLEVEAKKKTIIIEIANKNVRQVVQIPDNCLPYISFNFMPSRLPTFNAS